MAARLIQITVTGEGGQFDAHVERITTAIDRLASSSEAVRWGIRALYSYGQKSTLGSGHKWVFHEAKAEGPFCALCNQQIGYDQTEVVFHLDGKCRS